MYIKVLTLVTFDDYDPNDASYVLLWIPVWAPVVRVPIVGIVAI